MSFDVVDASYMNRFLTLAQLSVVPRSLSTDKLNSWPVPAMRVKIITVTPRTPETQESITEFLRHRK